MIMEVDPIEKAIGRFGLYQGYILLLLSLGRYPTEFQLTNVVFILPNVDYVCTDNQVNVTNQCPCENPVYDQSIFESTVTSTWNLICDRTWLASLAQSILQVGILAGSIVYGYISDRFGRKPAVLLALSVEVAAVAVSSVVPDLWMFIICRFLIGMALGGTMLCCYVHLIELCGKSFRPYIVALIELTYITGYMMLPGLAYLVRDWRQLQLVVSLPWVFVIAYYWLIPESPRWLVTVGKKKEAIALLIKIAKKNKKPINDIEEIVNEIETETLNEKKQRGSYFDLFKTPKIRIYTLIMALVWMLCAHTNFGINQYIGRIGGNIYINVVISASFLAPGLLLCLMGNVFLRRKVTVISCFVTAAIPLLIITFLNWSNSDPTAILVFAIIGQMGIYTSFVTIYLYSSEIFPTIVRNSGMGVVSVFARFGGLLAPFVVNIGIHWISTLIFSCTGFLAGFFCYFLPETRNTVLRNTIQQIEQTEYNTDKEVRSDDHRQYSVEGF